MFETLKPTPPDKIIAMMQQFRADPRADKIDLGVGVYKDAKGRTPVMRAVKAAERRLVEEQDSKAYVGLLGDTDFVDLMADLALGPAVPAERLAGAQTPGGTGAIHQLFELIHRASPSATVWMSDPTWPNHPAILAHLGIPSRTYRYFDAETRGVDFQGMMADLTGLKAGDVLLLHGCCHNPTGASLSLDQWKELTDFVNARGAVPMVDLAYQGFGDGLEDDVAGLRHMAAAVPELMLAASCSKNFGVYRDRVGAAFTLSKDKATADLARVNLASLNRLNYSFPPDHGARVVGTILADPALRADWTDELEVDAAEHADPAPGADRRAPQGDQLRPLRLRRRPPRHVHAPRPRAGAGRDAARRVRHLHDRRQPHQHRRPARRQARPPGEGDRRRRGLMPSPTSPRSPPPTSKAGSTGWRSPRRSPPATAARARKPATCS